jgi:hypothetical protein
VSFIPSVAFRQGELVTVRTGAPLVGASDGAIRFRIASYPTEEEVQRTRGTVSSDPEGKPRDAQALHTRKDIRPPNIVVRTRTGAVARDDLLVAPKAGRGQNGVQIADYRGRTIYFRHIPTGSSAYDFRVQRYRGEPAITWWQGRILGGKGQGYGVILNSAYHLVSYVKAGNGYSMDQHEFQLTPQGTAFINVYVPTRYDLSSVGGSRRGLSWDSIVQEVDIKTGLVLFEWHSLGTVDLAETVFPVRQGFALDAFHVNSVHLEGDGNLLLSARNANALYEVDRHDGHVLWRIGGKRSDFAMGPGTEMIGQHQAVRLNDGTISVFDNGGSTAHPTQPDRPSRGLRLRQTSSGVSLVRQYNHNRPLFSRSQGSVQILRNGNALLSWGGSNPYLTEYTPDGKLAFEARFAPSSDDTYRAYKLQWTGFPPTRPVISAFTGRRGTNVYASWNGATEVSRWAVLVGNKRDELRTIGGAAWDGLETRIPLPRQAPRYVAVRGLTKQGKVLGTSTAIRPKRVH